MPVTGLPRFFGGAVGSISYDFIRYLEPIPEVNPDELNVPEFLFFLVDTLLIFDHMAHTIKIVSNAFIEDSVDRAYEQAIEKIDQLYKRLQIPATTASQILDGDVMHRMPNRLISFMGTFMMAAIMGYSSWDTTVMAG